jgi:hypothetical protein
MARRGAFVLTPPTMVVFAISVILAVIAILAGYAKVAIPFVSPAHVLDTLVIAYLLLAAGVLFRQL